MGRVRTIHCKAGKSTKIISNFGSGYAKTFQVIITSDTNEPVSGTFEEKKYTWIFPKAPIEGKLEPSMLFHRDWINGIYKVFITPDVEVTVTIK